MATIKIKRSGDFFNLMRSYKIFIDGHFAGKIYNGKSLEFPTTAGQHVVVAKIDWCSSPDCSISIDSDETKALTVGSFKYGSWLMILGIALIPLLPLLGSLTGFGHKIFFLMPIILLPFYYMTFGRKKYLTLKETAGADSPRWRKFSDSVTCA